MLSVLVDMQWGPISYSPGVKPDTQFLVNIHSLVMIQNNTLAGCSNWVLYSYSTVYS